jgi:protease-4
LVDDLAYEDQIASLMGQSASSRVEDETYSKIAVPNSQAYEANARISVLYAVGTIASGKSAFDSPGGQVIGSETFASWVRKARVDTGTRAIVVRIDSPGGSAIASDVIWRELKLAAEAKPVIVSMGNVAASGGYYIAMPAQVVVAEPGTITGSIGVVTGKFAIGGTLEKLGIGEDSVKDGQFAELNSPFTPFSKDERAKVASQLQETYDLFLSRVAEGRHQTPAKIDTVAQGRVWTGHQAKDLGLVDEIGGLDTAITIARQKAKLDPQKNVDIIYYPARRSLFDLLSDQTDTSMQARAQLLGRPTAATRAITSLLSWSQLFRRGEPLAIMPGLLVR